MADNLANPDRRHGAAEPAGEGPANPVNGAPAPAADADDDQNPLMALLQRLDRRAERAELAAQRQQDQYNELRNLLNAQANELAALRGGAPVPPPGVPQAHPGDAPPAVDVPPVTPPLHVGAPAEPPRAGLVVGGTPSASSVARALPGTHDSTRLVADDDDNISVVSHNSRHDPTSKNYQNFLRAAEKQPPFTGADKDDVNEWLTSVEELADIHGITTDEILQGLKTLLAKSARRFYREHLRSLTRRVLELRRCEVVVPAQVQP